MAEAVQRRAEDLARYLAELSRRVATADVRDLGELAGLASRMRRALETVTPQEIAWAAEQATALVHELTTVQETLRALATLKRVVGGSSDRST